MESHEQTTLRHYLDKLGLQPLIADIYVTLWTHGPQTISQLARNAKIDRIKIYRLLEELKTSGLVEIEIKYKRSIIRAAPISNLQVLISKKEQELEDIKQAYPTIAAGFNQQALGSGITRVQVYEGADGLKQMLWKQTKGKGENLSILHGNMQRGTNLAFFERWTKKCNQEGVHFRSIIDEYFMDTQAAWYATHQNEQLTYWQGRQINRREFPITYSTVIYDDTVLQYNWNDEHTFGIEIESPDIARMHRQLFELLWERGQAVNQR